MSRIATLTAAVALAAALPLSAQTPQTGHEELALELGVDPDAFSASELAQMKAIMEADISTQDMNRRLQALFSDPPDTSHAATEQLAGSLGVDPQDYTLSELVMLKRLSEDDPDCVNRDPLEIVHAEESLNVATRESKEQLGCSLDVDPTQYTLSELVQMLNEADDND